MLETVDEHLLRSLVNGHSKTSLEFLYLEAGAIPIRFIISTRRLMFLQTILKRSDDELTRRVYMAQKDDPVKGDFVNLVKSDLEMFDGSIDEEYIQLKSKSSLKEEIKDKIRKVAFRYLKEKLAGHSKIKGIQYTQLKAQTYMTSPLFSNEEVNLLHGLRSRSVNVKCNFRTRFQNNLLCPLCEQEDDDQPHLLNCVELLNRFKDEDLVQVKSVYQDIFEDHLKQKQITHLMSRLIHIRNQLVDKNLCRIADPSMSDGMLENSVNLLDSIVHYSSGK